MSETSQAIEEIKQLEDARYAAMLGKDIPVLERLLDDKLIYMHSTGVADTKSSYIEGLRTGVWDYREVDRTELRYQADGGIDSVRKRERDRPAPPGRKTGDGRAAGQAERDADKDRTDCRKQQPATNPAPREKAQQPDSRQPDDWQQKRAAKSEEQEQRVAEIGAAASQPVRGRTAGSRAERGVGGIVGRQRDRAGEADDDEDRAPRADRQPTRGLSQRIPPIGRQFTLRRAQLRSPCPTLGNIPG